MALQVKLVQTAGIAAILFGIVVNILRTGVLSSITFAAIMTIILYLAVHQVSCLLTGKCGFAAWLSASTIIIAFTGVTYFYLSALISGSELPSIEKQPITELNPAVTKSIKLINKHTGINPYKLF